MIRCQTGREVFVVDGRTDRREVEDSGGAERGMRRDLGLRVVDLVYWVPSPRAKEDDCNKENCDHNPANPKMYGVIFNPSFNTSTSVYNMVFVPSSRCSFSDSLWTAEPGGRHFQSLGVVDWMIGPEKCLAEDLSDT